VATDSSFVSLEEAKQRVARVTRRNLPFAVVVGCLVGWAMDGIARAVIGGVLMVAFMACAGLLALAAWHLRR
jgi:hypothetical protein